MKKIAFIFTMLAVFLASVPFAIAVPNLQIYIPGAYYDMASETWIINSYDYELWVIGSSNEIKDVKIALAVPENEGGSIKIDWTDPDLFSFTMNSTDGLDYSENQATYTERGFIDDTYLYGDASEGEDPLDGNGKEIAGAGIFPTDFYEYYIGDFGISDTVYNFNPPDEDEYSEPTWNLSPTDLTALDTADGEIKKLHISVSGYTWVDIVAYDHIVKSNNKASYVFSPFSHDGESSDTVPEPATLLLFGFGLLGIAGAGRKVL